MTHLIVEQWDARTPGWLDFVQNNQMWNMPEHQAGQTLGGTIRCGTCQNTRLVRLCAEQSDVEHARTPDWSDFVRNNGMWNMPEHQTG